MMPVYKVSYVIMDSDLPGAIVNRHRRPRIGEKIKLGTETFQVVEVLDLMPPRGEFRYVHAACKLTQKTGKINLS